MAGTPWEGSGTVIQLNVDCSYDSLCVGVGGYVCVGGCVWVWGVCVGVGCVCVRVCGCGCVGVGVCVV